MEEPPASFTTPLALLPTLQLAGCWQMAIDAWMLEQRRPMLRLYRWRRPTLSLGRHQRRIEPHWCDLARSGAIDLVRRPSGGRAVLHGGDLTYALVWPDATGRREPVYEQACRWLQEAFAALGQPLHFGHQTIRSPGHRRPAAAGGVTGGQPASCFALSTAADLVDTSGCKRIGSAQHWHQGCLLQHGSIQLNPSADLWRRVFRAPAPELRPLPLTAEGLERALIEAARRWLPFAAGGMGPARLDAPALAACCRASREFQLDLASPEATIARTTGARANPSG